MRSAKQMRELMLYGSPNPEVDSFAPDAHVVKDSRSGASTMPSSEKVRRVTMRLPNVSVERATEALRLAKDNTGFAYALLLTPAPTLAEAEEAWQRLKSLKSVTPPTFAELSDLASGLEWRCLGDDKPHTGARVPSRARLSTRSS